MNDLAILQHLGWDKLMFMASNKEKGGNIHIYTDTPNKRPQHYSDPSIKAKYTGENCTHTTPGNTPDEMICCIPMAQH